MLMEELGADYCMKISFASSANRSKSSYMAVDEFLIIRYQSSLRSIMLCKLALVTEIIALIFI